MGISAQLVFPSFAIFASMLMVGNEVRRSATSWPARGPIEEIHELGNAGLAEYNAWAAATTSRNPDRPRCVAYIMGDGTVEDLVGQTEALIGQGIRAVNIPHGVPPAGDQPGRPGDGRLLGAARAARRPARHPRRQRAGPVRLRRPGSGRPAFKLGKVQSHELGLEPYSFATLYYTAAHFLTVLILGGVFERFPRPAASA